MLIGTRRAVILRRAGGGDPLSALTAWIGASTYADYNAKMLDRQFQESTGQTAVAASADKVGLWLDGAQWGGKTFSAFVAGQPDLAVNGSFGSDTVWTKGTGWSIAGGKATHVGPTTGDITQNILTTGSFYHSGYTILDRTIGVGVVSFGNPASNTLSGSANGTFAGIQQALGAAFGVRGATNYDGSVDDISARLLLGFHGLNATSAQRLNLLISGTRYTLTGDGSDDNLLTTWLAASGGNTIFFDVDVPVTIGSTQYIFGGQVSSSDRFGVFFNTSGFLGAFAGSGAAITGAVDYRGQRVVGAVTHDGANITIFVGVVSPHATGAQSGTPTTTIPARLGAYNTNGTAAAWFSGGIARIIPVQKGGLTLSDWQTIGPQLAAAGA